MMQLPSLITCDRQPWICVIDPALALSYYGVPLVKQLGKVMELWVVRELWHILDNSSFYLQKPELITLKGIPSERMPEQERIAVEETISSLQAWERFRMETDLAGLNLFWLGDSLRESLLPKSRNIGIFRRWESVASSLDDPPHRSQTTDFILPLAFRDAVALAACLESAFILTYQPSENFIQNLPPAICQALDNWSVPCQFLASEDEIVVMERDYLRQLLIHTDAAKFLWAQAHLTVLHLLIPRASEAQNLPVQLLGSLDDPKKRNSFWVGARGFWYLI